MARTLIARLEFKTLNNDDDTVDSEDFEYTGLCNLTYPIASEADVKRQLMIILDAKRKEKREKNATSNK